ncbi:rod shape-determining protein MreC [Romboutsia sedimentorum]|uniref:Cell shape-determining protein MreC n=1 Tax=Romboutsia sedimentorum TaxID=1368474 RepID=A0ABT7EBI8_9FIRM|nr:rod shape-determining protein MreC [Romboutsia sedimentorum]MDK2562855.1 rod shape-determining protein MreC [Romboutsia sedimentorum]MDK2585662.1 rod shape-determining protein MreC [Romboutsia sedimentorum]
MKFDKKEKKRINIKVIATGIVAITLIGIVGISIGKFSGANPVGPGVLLDGITVVEKNFNKGFTFLEGNFKELISYKKNANKIAQIEKENDKLKQEVIDLNKQIDEVDSLSSLKKSLDFVDEKYNAKSISATVVGKNDGNWYDSFTIGAGSSDGVKNESIVVNGNGLVGMVYEVSKNYSKAISLLDTKSSVSFKLLKDDKFKGVITQNSTLEDKENYKNKGHLNGYMFDNSYDVLPGDVVVTSGLGLYPKGIPIGEIDKVIDDKNKSMKYVVVRPYADFKNIDDVKIIEPRNIG